jgi:TonB family protein
MKPRFLSLTLPLLAIVCFIAFGEAAVAQSAPSNETRDTGVVLTKLSPPQYPPLSRQARITGDVKIQVRISRDGTVASADVVSGHPILKGAALASAQQSIFECRGCNEEVTLYSLTYSFHLREHVDYSFTHLRSIKCLYLWRCGGWRNNEPAGRPEVTQSQSHITILADPPYVMTNYANSAAG